MFRGLLVSVLLLLSGCVETEGRVADKTAFVTAWSLEDPDLSVIIPTDPAYTYAYSIEWGDGVTESGLTGQVTHTYDEPGLYVIRIRGVFPHLLMATGNVFDSVDTAEARNAEKLVKVTSWGDIAWRSMENMFANCPNVTLLTSTRPDLSRVTSMKNMFVGTTRFNSDIHDWNVSTVTDMSGMFFEASAFDKPLDTWDTRHVTTMHGMFAYATHFNQPLGQWDFDAVTDTAAMFKGAAEFDQAIGDWNVSRITDMAEMFAFARSFNRPLDQWDVSQVTDMHNMFRYARTFHNQDLSRWDVRSVTRHNGFLQGAGANNREPVWP